MPAKKDDPTVTSGLTGAEYPEGTHPARSASDVEYSASKLKYRDNPDKPDPTTVAQVVDIPKGWPGQPSE